MQKIIGVGASDAAVAPSTIVLRTMVPPPPRFARGRKDHAGLSGQSRHARENPTERRQSHDRRGRK